MSAFTLSAATVGILLLVAAWAVDKYNRGCW